MRDLIRLGWLVVPMVLVASAVAADYKNLTVLPEDISPADLDATMDRMTEDLDVSCAHCHDERDHSADSRPAKDIARRMMRMTIALNRDYFPDADAPMVTCRTCHQGKLKPATLPRRGPRTVPVRPEPVLPPDPRTLPDEEPEKPSEPPAEPPEKPAPGEEPAPTEPAPAEKPAPGDDPAPPEEPAQPAP